MGILWRVRNRLTRRASWESYPISEFRFGVPCRVPLAPYQERFGVPATQEQGLFRLSLLRGLGFSGNPFTSGFHRLNNLYADGEYGFALEWCTPGFIREDRTPVALVTFDREPYPDGWWIVVRQLQGVKWRRDYLHGVRWERMLLATVTDWARTHKYSSVACIRGQDSRWLDHGSRTSFKLRYDVSARRNGFRYHPDYRLWHLPLSTASA